MLNIFFGEMPQVVSNISVYFKNAYKPQWITTDLSREMILDIDMSEVISGECIRSPVFGTMPPTQLSGGVKTLILIAFDHEHIFSARNCGDNCAKWLLRIADLRQAQGQETVINIRHLMDFGGDGFRIRVLNTNTVVHNMEELLYIAGEYV